MLKVLYIIGSLGLGGSESQLTLLIRELNRNGWCCFLFAFEAKGPLRDVLKELDVVIFDGGYDSSEPFLKKIYKLSRVIIRLYRDIRRTKPDILHAFLPLANFFGALTGKLAGIRKIITSRRALGTHQDRYVFWKMFDRIANFLSHHITVNSEAVLRDTIKRDRVNPKKLVLIYNGLDHSRFIHLLCSRVEKRKSLGMEEHDIGVVMVANLIPYKGHADFLLALKIVLKNKPNVLVYFIGEDRGIRSYLEQMVQEFNLSGQIVFLGRRDDVPEILSAMDIYVMASHEEGFSNSLLEAMAAGLPILATDVGGNKEALDGGIAGLLVPPRNPAAMAAGLSELLGNSEHRRILASFAKERSIKSYSMDKMTKAYLRLYAE